MNVLDLFSGCGGLSLGFQNAGYHVVLGIDNDKAALETFSKNHTNSLRRMSIFLHPTQLIKSMNFWMDIPST